MAPQRPPRVAQLPMGQSNDASAESPTRLQRRKNATRQSLLKAARSMLADGSAATASIQDITQAADVGFGTFYNHFEDKAELFEAAAEQVFEQWGEQLDKWEDPTADPADWVASSFRRSGRLLITHRQEAELIARSGFRLLDSSIGLAPRARRGLQRAKEAGRFTIDDVQLALAKTAGQLFALLHAWLHAPDTITVDQIDTAAEELLRMFGMNAAQARRLSHHKLEGAESLAFWSADRQ